MPIYIYICNTGFVSYFQKLYLSLKFQELEQLHKMSSSLSDILRMWISIT